MTPDRIIGGDSARGLAFSERGQQITYGEQLAGNIYHGAIPAVELTFVPRSRSLSDDFHDSHRNLPSTSALYILVTVMYIQQYDRMDTFRARNKPTSEARQLQQQQQRKHGGNRKRAYLKSQNFSTILMFRQGVRTRGEWGGHDGRLDRGYKKTLQYAGATQPRTFVGRRRRYGSGVTLA